ncbi:MAG: hypothetical protein E4H06_04340 [Methanosarcina sp.]|nr:MAG: hypothetical protein E4H06_04340 [Methanosarcina sp.]
MNEIDIVRAVIEEGYQISPHAVELIKLSNSPEKLLKYILSTIDDCVFVIEPEHVDLKGFEASKTVFRIISGTSTGTVPQIAPGKISSPAVEPADSHMVKAFDPA